MAGKGGGAWKVAYADFVTAMMAFFLVMWITAQSKPVKQAVAKYFEDPLGMNEGSRSTSYQGPDDSTTVGSFESGRGPGRGLSMAELKVAGRRNLAGVAARKPPREIIFRHLNRTNSLGTVIWFDENSAELDKTALSRLNDIVPLLLGKPNKVEIRVYTPRRPLPPGSTFADNWQLTRARSMAAMKYLVDRGIDGERIRLSQEGELEPDTLYTEGGKPVPNSRVEIFALDEYIEKGRNASPPAGSHGGEGK